MTSSEKFPGNRGFTLVELLVVIAIAGILAVVGSYGYRSARQRADEAVSTTNLRQLAAANLLYASENQTYVPDGDPSNLVRWHGARTSASSRFDPTRGLLSEYLGDGRRVGRCPGFTAHLADSSSWENGSGGYGYNSIYIGGMPEDGFRPNRPANVPHPARTLMFATTAFAVAGGLQEYPHADPPSWVDANWRLRGPLQPSVHFRFGGRALIAWCDGHVSSELPSGSAEQNFYGGDNTAARIGFCGPSDLNGWWNPRN